MTERIDKTKRLQARIERDSGTIDQLERRFGLPLHLLWEAEVSRVAARFFEVARRLYPATIVAFAVKSNPCRGAVRTAARLGLGADVASEYELRCALEEGIPADRIVCNGNAKSSAYLELAVRAGARIAVDSGDEIDALTTIARARPADVLIRFSGMPLSGLTSADQTTAADWTKFGFPVSEARAVFRRVARSSSLRYRGISAHIGTQIADPIGYERLIGEFFSLIETAASLGLTTDSIDLGGGYPVSFLSQADWIAFTQRLRARIRGNAPISDAVTWNDLPMGYADRPAGAPESERWIGKAYWSARPEHEMLEHILEYRPDGRATTAERLRTLGGPTLIVEPGRSLFAGAGITLTRVVSVKRVLGHVVVALDMGINNHGTNLISPDLFPAAVLPPRGDDAPIEAFLAGRLCFSGDMISKANVPLNRMPRPGDRLVLYQTGAYSADHFASHSCGFPRPAKVAIRPDGSIELWRRPEGFLDVFGRPTDPLQVDGLQAPPEGRSE